MHGRPYGRLARTSALASSMRSARQNPGPNDGQRDDDGDDENGVCVDVGDACECSRVREASFSAAGAYLVQGEELQLLDGHVLWVTDDWCVTQDSLGTEASVSWGVPGYRNILGVRASLERAD